MHLSAASETRTIGWCCIEKPNSLVIGLLEGSSGLEQAYQSSTTGKREKELNIHYLKTNNKFSPGGTWFASAVSTLKAQKGEPFDCPLPKEILHIAKTDFHTGLSWSSYLLSSQVPTTETSEARDQPGASANAICFRALPAIMLLQANGISTKAGDDSGSGGMAEWYNITSACFCPAGQPGRGPGEFKMAEDSKILSGPGCQRSNGRSGVQDGNGCYKGESTVWDVRPVAGSDGNRGAECQGYSVYRGASG